MEEAIVGMPERLRDEIHEMCQQTVEMLKLTWEGFRKQDVRPLQPAEKLGREIHQREKALTALVVKRSADQAGAVGSDQALFFVPMHLERVGDNIEFLVRAIKMMVQEGIPFSERAMREVNTLFEKAIELVEGVRDVILTKNRVLIRYILEEGQRYEEMANEYALAHQQRLIEGVCMPKASSVYVAILDYLKGVEWHTRQIAKRFSSVFTS
ncbi:MAG: PhoU domain-containing protein [Candidatus Methylomirabilales bacterium]